MRNIFKRRPTEQQDFSSVAIHTLIGTLEHSVAVQVNRSEDKAAVENERANAVAIVKELQSRSLLAESANDEAWASEDTIGLLVGALSGAVAWFAGTPHNLQSEVSNVLQCLLAQLLEMVSPGEKQPSSKGHVVTCQQVVRAIPGGDMFAQLLAPEMTFWVKHYTISILAELLQWDGASFASVLVVSTAIVAPLVSLLRSTESEVSLLDKAICVLKCLTDPNLVRQLGAVSDERGLGVFHHLLVFEGIFEEVLRIVRVEGGIMAIERHASQLSVSMTEEVSLLGELPRCVTSVGSLEIVRDCVVVIRQLLCCCDDSQKYFDGNELVVLLSCTISFDGASRQFFRLDDGLLTVPPFVRATGASAQDTLNSREVLMLEVSSVLLLMGLPQPNHEERAGHAVQLMLSAPPGQWSIMDSVLHWLAYYAHVGNQLSKFQGEGVFVLHPALALFEESLLSVLHSVLKLLPLVAQTWLLEWQSDARKLQLISDHVRAVCDVGTIPHSSDLSTSLVCVLSSIVTNMGRSCRARFVAFSVLQFYLSRDSDVIGMCRPLEAILSVDDDGERDCTWSIWILAASIFSRLVSLENAYFPSDAVPFKLLCKFVILLKTSLITSSRSTEILCASICVCWMLEAMRRSSLQFSSEVQSCIEAIVVNIQLYIGPSVDSNLIAAFQTSLVLMCAPQFGLVREIVRDIRFALLKVLPEHPNFAGSDRDPFLSMVTSGCPPAMFEDCASFEEVREVWLHTSTYVDAVSSPQQASNLLASQDLQDALLLTLEGNFLVLPSSPAPLSTFTVLKSQIAGDLWASLSRDLVRGPYSLAMNNLRLFVHERWETLKRRAVEANASRVSEHHERHINELLSTVKQLDRRVQELEHRLRAQGEELVEARARDARSCDEVHTLKAMLAQNRSAWV